jgi:hypothetical protein
MSIRSSVRFATVVLVVILTTNIAAAAPHRDGGSDGFFGSIAKIVKQIGRILRPLEEPTWPKP